MRIRLMQVLLFTGLVLGLSLALPKPASAIVSYKPISGTSFYCVYLPNGKNKLSVKKRNKHTFVTKSEALAILKEKSLQYTKTRQSLQVQFNSLSAAPFDHTLTAKNIKDVIKFVKFFFAKGELTASDFPPNKADQLSFLQSLIDRADLGKQNTQNEINAVIKCSSGNRDVFTTVTIEPAVIYTKSEVAISKLYIIDSDVGLQGFDYIPDILHVCIDGRDVTFQRNPCIGSTFPNAINCPFPLPEFKYGHLNSPSAEYIGGTSNETLEAKKNELQTQWGSGVSGRLIVNSDDPCFSS